MAIKSNNQPTTLLDNGLFGTNLFGSSIVDDRAVTQSVNSIVREQNRRPTKEELAQQQAAKQQQMIAMATADIQKMLSTPEWQSLDASQAEEKYNIWKASFSDWATQVSQIPGSMIGDINFQNELQKLSGIVQSSVEIKRSQPGAVDYIQASAKQALDDTASGVASLVSNIPAYLGDSAEDLAKAIDALTLLNNGGGIGADHLSALDTVFGRNNLMWVVPPEERDVAIQELRTKLDKALSRSSEDVANTTRRLESNQKKFDGDVGIYGAIRKNDQQRRSQARDELGPWDAAIDMADDLVSNPVDTLAMGAASVPSLAASIAAGLGTTLATRNPAAGMAALSAVSGTTSAVDARNQVIQGFAQIPTADLSQLDPFQKIKEANPNASDDEIKNALAVAAANDASIYSGVLTAAIAKFGPEAVITKAIQSTIPKVGAAILASGASEAVDSGVGGAILPNLATINATGQEMTTEALTKGAVEQAVAGGVLGLGFGGVGAVGSLANGQPSPGAGEWVPPNFDNLGGNPGGGGAPGGTSGTPSIGGPGAPTNAMGINDLSIDGEVLYGNPVPAQNIYGNIGVEPVTIDADFSRVDRQGIEQTRALPPPNDPVAIAELQLPYTPVPSSALATDPWINQLPRNPAISDGVAKTIRDIVGEIPMPDTIDTSTLTEYEPGVRIPAPDPISMYGQNEQNTVQNQQTGASIEQNIQNNYQEAGINEQGRPTNDTASAGNSYGTNSIMGANTRQGGGEVTTGSGRGVATGSAADPNEQLGGTKWDGRAKDPTTQTDDAGAGAIANDPASVRGPASSVTPTGTGEQSDGTGGAVSTTGQRSAGLRSVKGDSDGKKRTKPSVTTEDLYTPMVLDGDTQAGSVASFLSDIAKQIGVPIGNTYVITGDRASRGGEQHYQLKAELTEKVTAQLKKQYPNMDPITRNGHRDKIVSRVMSHINSATEYDAGGVSTTTKLSTKNGPYEKGDIGGDFSVIVIRPDGELTASDYAAAVHEMGHNIERDYLGTAPENLKEELSKVLDQFRDEVLSGVDTSSINKSRISGLPYFTARNPLETKVANNSGTDADIVDGLNRLGEPVDADTAAYLTDRREFFAESFVSWLTNKVASGDVVLSKGLGQFVRKLVDIWRRVLNAASNVFPGWETRATNSTTYADFMAYVASRRMDVEEVMAEFIKATNPNRYSKQKYSPSKELPGDVMKKAADGVKDGSVPMAQIISEVPDTFSADRHSDVSDARLVLGELPTVDRGASPGERFDSLTLDGMDLDIDPDTAAYFAKPDLQGVDHPSRQYNKTGPDSPSGPVVQSMLNKVTRFMRNMEAAFIAKEAHFGSWAKRNDPNKFGGESDTVESWDTLRKAVGRKSYIEEELHGQVLKPINETIISVAERMGLDSTKVAEDFGTYLTMLHIPEANRYMETQLREEISRLETAINSNIDVQDNRRKLTDARKELSNFISYNLSGKFDGAMEPRVAGGYPTYVANEVANRLRTKYDLSDLNTISAQAQQGVDTMVYRLVSDGIMNVNEAVELRQRFNNYVPLYNVSEVDGDAYLGTGMYTPFKYYRRDGAVTGFAANGLVTMRMMMYNVASQSAMAPFSASLIRLVNSGAEGIHMVPATRDALPNIPGSRKKTPTYHVHTYNSQGKRQEYFIYFDDPNILGGIVQSTSNPLTRNPMVYAATTGFTTLYGKSLTVLNVPFSPLMYLKEVGATPFSGERFTNLASKKYKDSNGDIIPQHKVAVALRKNLWNLSVLSDLTRMKTDPNYSSKYTEAYKILRETGTLSRFNDSLRGKTLKGAKSELRTGARKTVSDALRMANDLWNNTFQEAAAVAGMAGLLEAGVSVQEATLRVLDSYDANQVGAWTKYLRMGYVFAQPAAQGAKNIAKVMSTPRGLITATATYTGFLAMTELLRSLMDDQQQDDYDKRNMNDTFYYHIPLPGGEFVKVPREFGISRITSLLAQGTDFIRRGKATPEEVTNTVLNALTQELVPADVNVESVGNDVVKSLLLGFAPQQIRPQAELAMNQSTFGNRIYGSAGVGENKSDNARARTSEVWTDIAQYLNKTVGIDAFPESYRHIALGYGVGHLGDIVRAMEAQSIQADVRREIGIASKREELEWLAVLGAARVVDNNSQLPTMNFYRQLNRADSTFEKYSVPRSNGDMTGGSAGEMAAARLVAGGASIGEARHAATMIDLQSQLRKLDTEMKQAFKMFRTNGLDVEQLRSAYGNYERARLQIFNTANQLVGTGVPQ